MTGQFSLSRIVAASVCLLAALFAVGWATRQQPDELPYLKIVGGGFMFNYRVAEVSYGFTAAVTRPLATGSIIEAAFEDPAGGPAYVVRERVGTNADRYSLHSPPVDGVEEGKPYRVEIKVMDREETEVLWRHELAFKSQLNSEILPDAPLTVGPGYHRPQG